MPSSVVITPRKLFLEDLSLSTSPTAVTSNQYVGGVGTIPLTEISAVLYTSFSQFLNDAAAATGGIGLGQIYWSTALSALKARLS